MSITELIIDFKKVCRGIEKKQQNLRLNCHVFCRALKPFIQDIKIVDGYFIGINIDQNTKSKTTLRRCYHSWFQTNDGAIIDIYPVGFITMTPILVASTGSMSVFGRSMYLDEPEVTKDIVNRDLYRNVRVIQKHLKGAVRITKARFKK